MHFKYSECVFFPSVCVMYVKEFASDRWKEVNIFMIKYVRRIFEIYCVDKSLLIQTFFSYYNILYVYKCMLYTCTLQLSIVIRLQVCNYILGNFLWDETLTVISKNISLS